MAVAAPTKSDAVLSAAVDVARSALDEITEPGSVGEHVGFEMLDERLGMHWFACLSAGYGGWRWGVSVARVPRGKVATVCETNLLPGADAVLAPQWLPYAERLAPGDLGAGDTLPYRADDPNLEAGFEATGDEDVDQVGFFELGLGRPRVLSAEGREQAATRWYEGSHGPTAEVATKATDRCTSCGYLVPMPGALRSVFGVCANAWSPSDGQVVSLDHGCGAHSETEAEQPEPLSVGQPIVDEFAVDLEPAERTVREPQAATNEAPATDADEPGESTDADEPAESTGSEPEVGADDPLQPDEPAESDQPTDPETEQPTD
ncbi:DUF3027 domain-containing protein [Terracoccus luteus]|uniref:DUF3027 domain-containing protein n=1 Tax=Terracoccus luteus TaxID=53356 RepID=UPI00160B2960|nr:DUF3027 domain-containing protein [Terracoccus luteus]